MNALAMDQSTLESTASILVNNAITVLNEPRASAQRLDEALRPFAVIQWTRPVIEHITVAKINRRLGRLKRSPIPKATLRLVIDHFHRALSSDPAVIPDRFVEWRDLTVRAALTNLANPDTWVSTWHALENHRIPDAQSLARVSHIELQTLADSSPLGELMTNLWQAVRIELARGQSLAEPFITFRHNIEALPEALRAPNAEVTAFGADFSAAKLDIGLPDDFDALGPAARITALQNATPDSQQLLRFLSSGAQRNILQQVRATLPCVASGLSCYLSFCSLLGIAPMPPSSTVVQQWGTIFGAGRTFQLYVGHLVKACQLLNIDVSWRDDAVRAVIKGLANKPTRIQRFSNSLTPEWLDKLIRLESWESEFALLAYITFLFMMRLPSEALPLRRALADESLLSDEPPSSKAVIGLRDFDGHQRLILKLSHRKNERNCFTAMRPCFCSANALLPRHNCPIRIFWAQVLRTTHPGPPLFPTLGNKNINRRLRAIFARLGIPGAERYSTHCFRRGAANAILQSGSTLAEIMRTAGWKSNAFRVYLNIQKAEECSMRAVLVEESSSSSDCVSDGTSSGAATPNAKSLKIGHYPSFISVP